jgi:1-acyl-sn-glycerol-3-phosphate acyltransferase
MVKTKHGKIYFIFYNTLKYILRIIFKILYRVETIDLDRIPEKGRLIICSNHISYLDPVIITDFMPGYIYFMAKEELYDHKILGSLISFFNAFPVKREGFSIDTFRTSQEVLKSENILGIFPEGTRSTEGIIREGKRGVGLLAVSNKAPILPIAISGTNKVIQKPHKRLFFPKIKIIAGNIIDVNEILEKYDKREAENIIVSKTMEEIKRLYDKIK